MRTLRILRTRLTYANVMATIAVFVSLGGTSWAALTVTGAQVRNNSLSGADVRNNSLTGVDVRNGSLSTADLSGAARGDLADADTIDGIDSASFATAASVTTLAQRVEAVGVAGIPWSRLSGIPADLADGDHDVSALWENVSGIPADLADGDQDVAAQWDKVSGVPAELADGDQDTTYTAGSGLQLSGSSLAVKAEGIMKEHVVLPTGARSGTNDAPQEMSATGVAAPLNADCLTTVTIQARHASTRDASTGPFVWIRRRITYSLTAGGTWTEDRFSQSPHRLVASEAGPIADGHSAATTVSTMIPRPVGDATRTPVAVSYSPHVGHPINGWEKDTYEWSISYICT